MSKSEETWKTVTKLENYLQRADNGEIVKIYKGDKVYNLILVYGGLKAEKEEEAKNPYLLAKRRHEKVQRP